MSLLAPCAVGDVLDRITILRIKLARVAAGQRANVAYELESLLSVWCAGGLPAPELVPEYGSLAEVNAALWNVEDRLRAAEAAGSFGDAFVADARSVYVLNDRRASLKRAVNTGYGSLIVEEKFHAGYGSQDG